LLLHLPPGNHQDNRVGHAFAQVESGGGHGRVF
jgi:hypothetical protein